jgi:hypothetical protein
MKRLTAVALMAGVVVAIGIPVATAAPSKSTLTQCHYNLSAKPWHVNGRTGTKWIAGSIGATCAFIKPWVAKLGTTHSSYILKGPTGWKCTATSTAYGFQCVPGSKKFAVEVDLNS